ncbi:MAG: GreA/GreB family elongation factor [Candidatus Sungbacteria bacterium]|nr:GreA/GreB family elongation factor [Candidatus Sungbacteria bacterium]
MGELIWASYCNILLRRRIKRAAIYALFCLQAVKAGVTFVTWKGIGQKITELDELIGRIRRMPVSQGMVQLGALALVAEGEHRYYVLVVPEGAGGHDLSTEDARIVTLAPTSPIGRALLRKQVGDEIEINLPSGNRVLEILEVT